MECSLEGHDAVFSVETILAFESALSSILTNTVNCLKFPVLWVKSSISEN